MPFRPPRPPKRGARRLREIELRLVEIEVARRGPLRVRLAAACRDERSAIVQEVGAESRALLRVRIPATLPSDAKLKLNHLVENRRVLLP